MPNIKRLQSNIAIKPYGVRMNIATGRSDRLGSLSGYNDISGALTWTETDSPMAAHVALIKASLSVHNKMRRCVVNDTTMQVAYYLDPSDSTKKTDGTAANLDGTDGQVMVELPKFWYKTVWVDDNTAEFWVSPKAKSGYSVHPCFNKNGVEVNARYIGAYEAVRKSGASYLDGYAYNTGSLGDKVLTAAGTAIGASDKIGSVSGKIPVVNSTRAQFRTGARNITGQTNDSHWRQLDWDLWFAIQMLMVIEYASYNSQKRITGSDTGGLCNHFNWGWNTEYNNAIAYYPLLANGSTNSLGNASGGIALSMPQASADVKGTVTYSGWTRTGSSDPYKYTHDTGNTTPITTALAPLNTAHKLKYKITEGTAGSITMTFGGVNLSVTAGWHTEYPVCINNNVLTITPTSDFDGSIESILIFRPQNWTDVVPSYRGIENPFGHIWQWIDGVTYDYVTVNQLDVYLSPGPYTDDSVSSPYTRVLASAGVNNSPASGYQMAFNNCLDRGIVAKSIGGSNITGLADYYYAPSSAVKRVVAVGGYAASGGSAGAFCVAAFGDSGGLSSAFGGRLCL